MIFNGQNWAHSTLPLTPDQQQQMAAATERAQATFAGAVRSNVGQLLDLQSEQVRETAGATAAGIQAEGYGREAAAYESAALTSEESAHLSEVSSHLTEYQDMRKYQQTAGSQAAGISAAGFKNSGSALYLAKSSFQQANLTQQIDVLNGTERSIGYLETAAATRAQGSAAGTARDAATALQTADNAAAATTGSRISDMSTAMQTYMQSVDPTSVTPEARLSLSLLGGNPDQALSDTAGHLTQEATTATTPTADTSQPPTGWMRNTGWGLH